MRQCIMILAVFTLSGIAAWLPAEPVKAESRIESVTVYLDHAYVTRVLSLNCRQGLNEFLIPHLPAELRDNSIRVSASGGNVRGIRLERIFLERSNEEEIRKLQDALQAIRDEETALKDQLALIASEQSFLDNLRRMTASQSSRKLAEADVSLPDIESMNKLLEMVVSGTEKNTKKKRGIEKKMRDLAPRMNVISRQLSENSSGHTLVEKAANLIIDSPQQGSVSVKLSYLLPGAMWFPNYDVRANLDTGKLELIYYAIIQQATGEKWDKADLTLNASRPARQSSKPVLAPWVLGEGESGDGYDLGFTGTSTNAYSNLQNDVSRQYAARGKWQGAHSNLMKNVEQVVRMQQKVVARGTSVTFPVNTRETVMTDGKPHRVVLATLDFDLATEYSTIPMYSLSTYVTGKAINTGKLPILPGEASIFLAGDLIGKSTLDFIAPGEEASFYLGVDESIKVTRELDKKLSSLRSFSKKKRVEAIFSVKIDNFSNKPVTVLVEEAMPVSQHEDISVKLYREKPEKDEGDHGIYRWRPTIPAKGTTEITFGYRIDYPNVMPEKLKRSHNWKQTEQMMEANDLVY